MYRIVISLLLNTWVFGISLAQNTQIDILNEVITELIGEQDNPDIPTFTRLTEVCRSSYVSCNKKNKIIGLDFQFANLNGNIQENIVGLEDLEYINLEYNYLSGAIPDGLSKLEQLEELSFRGNFLTGKIPLDLAEVSNRIDIDLSQNVIKVESAKLKRKLNVIDQVNLEGCRSPDSIFLNRKKNFRKNSGEILPDLDNVEVEPVDDKEIPDNALPVDEESIPKVVEVMPRFPGCENEGLDGLELTQCAQRKMLEFIYRNLRYPDLDRERGMQGMVVVQFTVLQDGSIGDVSLVRNPGGRLGNSGVWIINRMNYICEKWQPGMQRNRPVKVLYTMPLKFRLQ